jgi:hypothetical protein
MIQFIKSIFTCPQIETTLDTISLFVVEMKTSLEDIISQSSSSEKGGEKGHVKDVLGKALRNVCNCDLCIFHFTLFCLGFAHKGADQIEEVSRKNNQELSQSHSTQVSLESVLTESTLNIQCACLFYKGGVLFDVAGRESEINLQESRAFDG